MRSAKLSVKLLDAPAGATVGWVKEQLVAGLLPHTSRYNKLPLSQCHLYFPATSEHELTDDSCLIATLARTGEPVSGQQQLHVGAKWQGDEKAAKMCEDESAEENEDVEHAEERRRKSRK